MISRVLVVANESLSRQSSNGRTLLNFLKKIPKENIAQFCLRGTPDEDVCSTYYKVTDRDALNALLMRKSKTTQSATEKRVEHPTKRTCKNLCLRDLVWRTYRWWTKDFSCFLNEFQPEIVLFQAGDAPFMFEIAMRIAKQFSAPLVMYNSENYVLKEKMFSSANKNSLWHRLLKRRLTQSYKRIMDRVSYCIYNTEHLESCYQQAYPHPGKSAVFYTVSEMPALPAKEDETFSLLYCGNLGVGRVAPLCQMAEVLYKVAPDARLDIYGSFANEDEKALLCALPNVYYGGIVPYSQIPELMQKASLLVHCENPERLENLKGAFSTKIADSLACGRPFLVYADRAYPFVQYLMKYDCAHIAATPEELEVVLQQCIGDQDYRYRFIPNALKTAKTNHNSSNNCEKITDVFAHIMK